MDSKLRKITVLCTVLMISLIIGTVAVIHLLKGGDLGVDHIPYTIENLLFDLSRKNSVEQTLFAYEMMCGENGGNEKVCRKHARAIVSMYEKDGFEFPQVITFCNKSSQYITKYMRFRNFLVTLLTTVYYPISLL